MVIFIVRNQHFCECTKHIEVDSHYVNNKVLEDLITKSVISLKHPTNIFTDGLRGHKPKLPSHVFGTMSV